MRYVDVETGEIFDVVQIKRFRKAQKRLTRQSQPLWRPRYKRPRRSEAIQWWLRLMNHLGPMVVLGAIAVALLLHN